MVQLLFLLVLRQGDRINTTIQHHFAKFYSLLSVERVNLTNKTTHDKFKAEQYVDHAAVVVVDLVKR